MVRHSLESLPERRESLGLLLEFVDLQAGKTMEQIGLHARLCLHRDAPLQHVRKCARVAEPREESIERAEDDGVVSHPLRSRDVSFRGSPRIVQLLLAHLAEAHEQVGPRDGVEDRDRPLLERVRVALPPLGPGARREAFDVRMQRRVLRLLREGSEQGRLGSVRVAERRLQHLGHCPQRLRPVRRLGLRAEAQLEDRRQLIVPPRRAEHRLERIRGVAAELVVRLPDAANGRRRLGVEPRLQHVAIRLERRLRVLKLHRVQRRDALLQSTPRPVVGGCARLELQVLQKLWPQTLLRVQPVEPPQHVSIARADGQRLHE